MTYDSILARTATSLALITSVLAQQLPYNPTYLIKGENSKVYQFSPVSKPQLAVYDATNTLTNNDAPAALTSSLPFLNGSSNSYIPVLTRHGLAVFSGECSEGDQELDLWTYGFGPNNQTWSQMKTTSSDTGLSAQFLASGFAFPSETDQDVDSLYIFGGMCPSGSVNASSMASDASYSNTMLIISPEQGNDYDVALTGMRGPPIAEAGLTITPLLPSSVDVDNTTQQQNFVLIGGHTQNAFINMSQVAMFSLPQQSWAFLGIDQPPNAIVEPRSGHVAVMTADGARIVVFGGWVGSTTNAATPQLAILEIGSGYGGNDSWSWTVPNIKQDWLGAGDGLYGHGAVMLPGDIMMITGGQSIAATGAGKVKRAASNTKFFNITSSSWSDSYTNPEMLAATYQSRPGMSSTQKAGLGAGLGIGIPVLIAIAVIGIMYYRKKQAKRRLREQELREMAFGNGTMTEVGRANSQQGWLSGYRSASWGARQEQQIEGRDSFEVNRNPARTPDNSAEPARFDASSLPSDQVTAPSHILRSSLRTRGHPGFGNHIAPPASGVFTIEEADEQSDRGSIRRPDTAGSRPLSDPFKDPPLPAGALKPLPADAAERRKNEVQTWVEDWQSAAESLHLSRSTSKANSYGRTYSNISAFQSSSSSSGREHNSDRTNSDLSESSNYSNLAWQVPSRTVSQKSNTGYRLFAGAAAAMGKLAGRQDHAAGVQRSESKRAISTGDLSQLAVRKRSNSNGQMTISRPLESPVKEGGSDYFATPPESPVKEHSRTTRQRSNSANASGLTNQSRQALGTLRQGAKRILTGTGTVSVQDKVVSIEGKSKENSPIKITPNDPTSRQVSSSGTSFWKHKQGARDWEEADSLGEGSSTIRRRSGRPTIVEPDEQDQQKEEDPDWDVETAVQQRVVQVMFTVPKEKLRVVNADNLSLLSRSDTHASRNSNRSDDNQDKEFNRMSRLTEAGEAEEESTIVGSSLHPRSAMTDDKGKGNVWSPSAWPELRSHGSGSTIGKAV